MKHVSRINDGLQFPVRRQQENVDTFTRLFSSRSFVHLLSGTLTESCWRHPESHTTSQSTANTHTHSVLRLCHYTHTHTRSACCRVCYDKDMNCPTFHTFHSFSQHTLSHTHTPQAWMNTSTHWHTSDVRLQLTINLLIDQLIIQSKNTLQPSAAPIGSLVDCFID